MNRHVSLSLVASLLFVAHVAAQVPLLGPPPLNEEFYGAYPQLPPESYGVPFQIVEDPYLVSPASGEEVPASPNSMDEPDVLPTVEGQVVPLSASTEVDSEKPAEPVGRDSGLWKWTPVAKYHQSIVEVSAGGGSGSGVLISVNKNKPVLDGFEGVVLTAWHVVQDDIVDGSIKVTYRNNQRAKGCQVLQHDEEKDVAILWVWVPKDIAPAKLATKSVKRGDKLELVGLGGGTDLACCVRAFEAFASPPSTIEKIFADVPLLPGDSGGPVFNADHEVVGIISGGWFWWDSGLKTANGSYIRTTWPARASNVGPIRTMMAKLKIENRIAESTTTSSESR
jgi:serine protease Do